MTLAVPRVELRDGKPDWRTCSEYVDYCLERFAAGGVFAWMRAKYSRADPPIPFSDSHDEEVMVKHLKNKLALRGVAWDESQMLRGAARRPHRARVRRCKPLASHDCRSHGET